MAARARVERVLVERLAQALHLRVAPRVGPRVRGRRGPPRGVEAEEPVPERGDADAAHVGGRPRSDAVEAGDDRVEQTRRVVLDAAVGRDVRLVRHLMKASWQRLAASIEERGARRRGADVDRDDDGVHERPP